MNAFTPLTETERETYDRLAERIALQRDAERLSENQALVGRCYKYWNSYGSGENWWMFVRVIGVKKYWPEAFVFQKTSKDEYRIELKDFFSKSGEYKEISNSEFTAAWDSFLSEVNGLRPLELKSADSSAIKIDSIDSETLSEGAHQGYGG